MELSLSAAQPSSHQPVCSRVVSETKAVTFTRPRKLIVSSGAEPPELGYVDIRTLADSVCRYDLNDLDVAWLQLANEEFKEMGQQSGISCLFFSFFLKLEILRIISGRAAVGRNNSYEEMVMI